MTATYGLNMSKSIPWKHRVEKHEAGQHHNCGKWCPFKKCHRLAATPVFPDMSWVAGLKFRFPGLGTIQFVIEGFRRDHSSWSFSKLVRDCPYCNTPMMLIGNIMSPSPPMLLSHSTGMLTAYLIVITAHEMNLMKNGRRKLDDVVGDALYEHCPVLNENVRKEEAKNSKGGD